MRLQAGRMATRMPFSFEAAVAAVQLPKSEMFFSFTAIEAHSAAQTEFRGVR